MLRNRKSLIFPIYGGRYTCICIFEFPVKITISRCDFLQILSVEIIQKSDLCSTVSGRYSKKESEITGPLVLTKSKRRKLQYQILVFRFTADWEPMYVDVLLDFGTKS